jgi:DNA polymerase (family X)
MDRFEIARLLREIGVRMGIAGEDRFRARAYETGARALESLREDVETLAKEGRLTTIPGIGPALAGVIGEIVETGRSRRLEALRAAMPAEVLEMSRVEGVTPKRREALRAAGIGSIEELEAACRAQRVRLLPGFGAKTEARLLAAAQAYGRRTTRMLLTDALDDARPLLRQLENTRGVHRAAIAGSIRRALEIVGNADFVATGDENAVRAAVDGHPSVVRSERRPPGLVFDFASGLRGRVFAGEERSFGAAWIRATGSAAHVERLEQIADERGLRFDASGLARRDRGGRWRRIAAAAELDLYAALGLPWIPPEMREDAGEIEAAQGGDTMADLIQQEDVLGMVHCHTTWSDGKDTILDMARGAEAMGMRYLTITDHSPTAFYAGGVKVDALKRQWEEIDAAQGEVGIKLLRGTESDILGDGALDYPDAVLERFDVIIASIHNRLKMDEDAMTKRVIAAMRRPVFKIWGHALGRLLNRREPFACRVEEVLDAVADSPAAVEINGDPHRLDMEPRWIREARNRGIPFVISTDAHSVGGMRNLGFGVGIARRGGVRRREVLNARDAESFAAAVRPARV